MDETSEIMDFLLSMGAIKTEGIDQETGEKLYRFTDSIKEIYPELYSSYINDVNSVVMRLWEKGYLDVDLLSDNPLINLSKSFIENPKIDGLDHEEQKYLLEIVRILAE